MNVHFPKILLVCGFNQNSANGITIANMFSKWPKGSLALVEYHACIEEICIQNIADYYLIGDKEAKLHWPFSYFKKVRPSSVVRLEKSSYTRVSRRSTTSKNNKLIREIASIIFGLKLLLLKASGLIYISRKYKVSSELLDWIKSFNPDYIYATVEDLEKMEFLSSLKAQTNMKLVIHTFDDWINSGHPYWFLHKYWNKRLTKTFKHLVGQANIHFSISEKMGEIYREKYGPYFYYFHNPAEKEIWYRKKDTNSFTLKNSFKFVYTGVINADTAPPIKKFIIAIKELNITGYHIGLDIYSPYPEKQVLHFLGMENKELFKGRVEYLKLPEILSNADGLLLPLAFNKRTTDYLKLSMSTKTAEYLMSGTPIFLFAPPEIALTEYFTKHKSAFMVEKETDLKNAIRHFIDNRDLRMKISESAQELALREHTTDAIAQRLLNILT